MEELKFAAIIPNRGTERKLFLEWQKVRVLELGYDKTYLIDYLPQNDKVDIYERLVAGVNLALDDGIDYCSIIESDDFYQLDYLDTIKARMDEGIELFGINQTLYYHLFSTGWKRMSHPGRSSLFCTTFKTSAFERLPVVNDTPFIDMVWWQHATKGYISNQLINDDLAIGIKHGNVFGRVGGNGHFISYSAYDRQLKMIKGLMDTEAFEFFSGIKYHYQNNWQQGLKHNE